MKTLNRIALLSLVLSMVVLANCKEDDNPPVSQKELVVEALTTGTWSVDATNTDVSGVTGSLDESTFTVSFTETASGISFDLGGDVEAYVSGGSFDLSDDATVSNVSLDLSPKLTAKSGAAITATEGEFEVIVGLEPAEDGRVGGIGLYTIAFVKQ